MAEVVARNPWPMRLAFAAIALTILFAQLLPLRTTPSAIGSPDLITALVFAWALRRPDFVPALLLAAVLFLADLLLGRPPGLWAALVLIAAEWLKAQGRRPIESTFAAEWVTVAIVLLVTMLAYRVVLGIMLVAPGGFALYAAQFALTVAAYPLVVFAGWALFGVRHVTPGEFDGQTRQA